MEVSCRFGLLSSNSIVQPSPEEGCLLYVVEAYRTGLERLNWTPGGVVLKGPKISYTCPRRDVIVYLSCSRRYVIVYLYLSCIGPREGSS